MVGIKVSEDSRDIATNRTLLLILALVLGMVAWIIWAYKDYQVRVNDPRSDYNSEGQCP